MYDAIVVGARVTGAPTAMLLARQGQRVLLLDRATFPSDTISTHFLQPRGSSYLKRWGLLDRVLSEVPSWSRMTITKEGIAISGTQPLEAIRARLARLTGDGGDYATTTWCAPRRMFLDKLLVDAAVEAGAELREAVVTDDLLFEGDRVVGVQCRQGSRRFEERARLVIGADGKHSVVARSLGLPRLEERPRHTFAYYSYWSGLTQDEFPWPMHFKGRLAAAIFPTNDGLFHVLVFGPDEWFRSFRADVDGNYLRALRYVAPEVADIVETKGRREERIVGTVDQPNFFRPLFGEGWVLAGDAANNKDQCTAIGMTHGFRDAELVARAAHEWLCGRPREAAFGEYERLRAADAMPYYGFVCDLAEMRVPSRGELELVASLAVDQAQGDRFLGLIGDAVEMQDFFSDENIEQIKRSSGDAWRGNDVFRNLDATQRAYRNDPFAEPIRRVGRSQSSVKERDEASS